MEGKASGHLLLTPCAEGRSRPVRSSRHSGYFSLAYSLLRARAVLSLRCLVLLVLASCGAPRELAVRSLISPFRMPMVGSPSALHQDIRFVTADGLALDGWLFEPPAGTQSRGLVVFLHGKDANRGHFAGDAVRFTARGYTVLAYDQRAHGRSEGQWCTFGIKEVPDLQLALDRYAPVNKPVYVIGESMGAAVALEAAARDPRIAGVVAAASFSDLRTIVTEHTPFFMGADTLAAAVQEAEARAGFHIDDVNPARDALDIRVPTLLLHGSDDPYIAPQHSRRIRKNLSGRAQLVTMSGVQHIDVLLHEEAWAEIERWFADIT